MTWTMAVKNGFSPNQLVFGRNPVLPNLIGENNPSSHERGGQEEYLRGTMNSIHKSSVEHIQQESEERTQ